MKEISPFGLWNIKFFQLDDYLNWRKWEEKAFNVASKETRQTQSNHREFTVDLCLAAKPVQGFTQGVHEALKIGEFPGYYTKFSG